MFTSVALSPDGKKIVSGSRDSASGEVLHELKGHSDDDDDDDDGKVSSVAFSPVGKQIAIGYKGNIVRVWRLVERLEKATV